MTRRTGLAITVMLGCGFGVLAIAGPGSANQAGTTGSRAFKPVMPLGVLMHEQERHFDAMLELLRNRDTPKLKKKLRYEALALGEMANINGYHGRATKHEDYAAWAKQLKEQSIEFAGLAKAEKYDEAKKLARKMNKTCNACHDKYD